MAVARGAVELPLRGEPIELVFQPRLTLCCGKLLSGQRRGTEVHAGCFIRQRRIVLDDELLRTPGELDRILRHELFHFVWVRIGNSVRREFEQLIRRELAAGVAGELGWSAEWRKNEIKRRGRKEAGRRWRAYLCESFCDTGAWRWQGGRHGEFTLPQRWRALRKHWWDGQFAGKSMPV